MLISILLASVLLLPNETAYRDEFCAYVGGSIEVVTPLGTRADCVTSWGAFELDYMKKPMKWAEMIGQASHYADQLNRFPVAVPIVETVNDCKDLAKAYSSAKRAGVLVIETGPYANKCPKP